MANKPEHHDVPEQKRPEQPQVTSPEVSVNSPQTFNDSRTILQNNDQLMASNTDQFLPSADSLIADALIAQRGIEGNEQAWAQGKIPPLADYNGYHPSENIVVRWPAGHDPKEYAGMQLGEPTSFGNATANIMDIPPVPGKSNYWNALANPWVDDKGQLHGTPMHIERGPNKRLPNGQVVKGDVLRYVNSNVNVACENHYPKKSAPKTANA